MYYGYVMYNVLSYATLMSCVNFSAIVIFPKVTVYQTLFDIAENILMSVSILLSLVLNTNTYLYIYTHHTQKSSEPCSDSSKNGNNSHLYSAYMKYVIVFYPEVNVFRHQ